MKQLVRSALLPELYLTVGLSCLLQDAMELCEGSLLNQQAKELILLMQVRLPHLSSVETGCVLL